MVMKRFELYVNAEEDIIAVHDKLTGEKHTTLDAIIDLLNMVADEDYYYNQIIKFIEIYTARVENNKGIVINGDVYNAKLSVLNELIKK